MANLLLHFDGVDGSTSFIDNSFGFHIFTEYGNAKIVTAQSKFGGASAYFDGSGDYISSSDNADWNWGTTDWTVEFFVRRNGNQTNYAGIISGSTSANIGWAILWQEGGTNKIKLVSGSSGSWANDIISTIAISNLTWTHVAVVRYGNTITMYFDGNSVGSVSVTGRTFTSANTGIVIGRLQTDGNNYYYNGWLDELRMLKGTAAYTSSFTPPIVPYSDESETQTKDILNKINTIFGRYAVISNKVNYSKQTLKNIINKINSCKLQTPDAFNTISFLGRILSTCTNKINTRMQHLPSAKNDIRFLKSWQKSASFGPQSLGKQYIKVYINGIEQTDVDVDSITITKKIGNAHTASFLLGRPYDSTKPAKELRVVIKYADYPSLYEGYVTRVSPTDTPDVIQVECQDEFWNKNRDVSYFFVGHKPINDTITTYYETMKQALSSEFGLNWNIGNFTPETISCYSIGKSEVLSSLIKTSGNYDYYYDINGNPQLWISGAGEIINLNLQQIGKNLGLYDVIRHHLASSIEDLVNQYRVLMGVEGARENNFTGSTVPYSIYSLNLIEDWCSPAWDGTAEILAKDSEDGKGVNWFPKEDNDKFKDVFRVWNLPYFTNTLQVWSDKYPPVVKIYNNFNNYVNIFTTDAPVLEITEGFSIDYEKRQLIFHDQLYLILKNGFGLTDKIKAPAVKIQLGLKAPHVVTDTRNPLVFITPKMGTYPKTIQKNLILSQYSVELGAYYYDQAGNLQPIPGRVMPSWDDTPYAMDYANWQLSQICDEKITGQIELTLDMICYYGVDLSKRVFSSGIMDNPLNIVGMTYKLSDFTVSIDVQNGRLYNRTVSLQKRWV